MVYIKYSKNDTDRFPELCETASALLDSYEKVYVIVPEQLSLQREFSLGSRFAGRVSAISFKRLSDEIFRRFGGGAKRIPDDVTVAAAVYKAVLKTSDKLTYYKSVAKNPGFVSKLISAFSEFEINRLTRESVFSLPENQMSLSVKNKYTDLFNIYEEYKSLWQNEYKAPGDDIVKAAEILELNPFFEDCAVIFDGFYGFTPSQQLMISRILESTDSVTFYFITDLESELFKTVNAEIKKLEGLCKKAGAPFTYQKAEGDSRYACKSLATLERNLFSPEPYKPDCEVCDAVTVYSAKNLSEELGFIACKIKNDVLSGKYRYKDIAILAPEPDSIATVISAVFEKHSVPLFTDVKRTLLSKPLMAFVLGAISTVTDGFEFETLFSFLKTGLTGIPADDISRLESYVRTWKIRGKGWQGGDWTQSPAGLVSKEHRDSEKDLKTLEHLNSLRLRIILPLEEFSNELKSAKTCKAQLVAVYNLLNAFDVRKNLENTADSFLQAGNPKLCEEYIRIYDIFIDMCESIYTVFGEDKLSVTAFYDLITVCASAMRVSHRPSAIDEVVFAGIGLVREENIKCVYIPCMNEGIIPKPYSDSALITEAEKRLFGQFGIPVSMDFITKSMRERFELYIALTCAVNEVVVSYREFEITGEAKNKSEYVDDITSAVPCRLLQKSDMDKDFYFVSVSGASEMAQTSESPEIAKAVYELTGFSPITEQDDSVKLESEVVRGIYSDHLRLSFSGIEEYVNCPFKFFVDRGLRISKSEPVEFNPANMGTFIHAGLERLLCGDYDIASADEKTLKKIIDDISDDYYNTDLKDCKDRSKRFDYLFSRAKYAFENAAESVVREIKNSDFAPYDFEVDISDSVKPIALKDGFTLSLVGSIDRVDISREQDADYVKIIDYKSGSQKFSLKKIYNGLSMQLPIYASAVRAKHGDVKFAAIYYLKVGVPTLSLKSAKGIDDETYSKMLAEYYTRDGLFCDDTQILQKLDKSGEILSKVKKTSIVNSENIDELVDYTSEKVKEIGDEIVSGNIISSPVCDSDVDACRYCDYKDICNIEKNPERVRTLIPLPDDFLQKEDNN